MIYSQYENNPLEVNGESVNLIGTTYNFEISFALDLILMAVIGIAIRLLALLVMYIISNPSLEKLKDSDQAKTLNMRRFNSRRVGPGPQ